MGSTAGGCDGDDATTDADQRKRFNNVIAWIGIEHQSNESSEKARIEQGEFPHPWLITGVDLHVAT